MLRYPFSAGVEELLFDHINLPLIQAATGVVSRRCPIHRQYIRLVVVSRHNDQLPAIEFLIAEIDDLGMTTIVLPQQHRRRLRPCHQSRGEQTVCGKMIGFRKRVPVPYRLTGLNISAVQNIGKLLEIANDYDISGTSKR